MQYRYSFREEAVMLKTQQRLQHYSKQVATNALLLYSKVQHALVKTE